MDLGQFAFEGVAEGLCSTLTHPPKRTWITDRETYNQWNPSKWVSRVLASDGFTDSKGKPLTENEAQKITTWRTYNSFSARCGVAKVHGVTQFGLSISEVRVAEISSLMPLWLSRQPADYRSWTVEYYLRSSAELPSILVSVGPYFYPYTSEIGLLRRGRPLRPFDPLPASPEERNTFDRKMLQTPLIWEEPYTVSVELNHEAILLWSDTWEVFGQRLSDEPAMQKAENGKRFGEVNSILKRSLEFETMPGIEETPLFEAFIRLDWSTGAEVDVTGRRQALLGVWRGEMDYRSGVYEDEMDASETVEEKSQSIEMASVGSGDSEESEAADLGKRVKVRQMLRCNWTKVGEQKFVIPPEAVNVFFTPYVTLLAGGDTAVIIGGENHGNPLSPV